jgi:hypothetical protein
MIIDTIHEKAGYFLVIPPTNFLLFLTPKVDELIKSLKLALLVIPVESSKFNKLWLPYQVWHNG